jgi:hypothetical protein
MLPTVAVGAARPGLADGLVAVGAVLSVYGVGLLSVPGAFILAGVLLAAMGVLAAYRHG